LQVLTDPFASEHDIDQAWLQVQERVVAKYKAAMPPLKVQSRVSTLQFELQDMDSKRTAYFNRNGQFASKEGYINRRLMGATQQHN
jgi:hypothetical protein